MKIKHIVCLLAFIFSVAGLAASAYAGDKRGIRDVFADKEGYKHYKREAVGDTGRYIVRGGDAWIEDEDGNDLFTVPGGNIAVLSAENGLYSTIDRDENIKLINKNFETVVDCGYQLPFFSNFGGELVIAVPDEFNKKKDPAYTKHTRYYDNAGNEIKDIYKYVSDRGLKLEDCVYADPADNQKHNYVRRSVINIGYDDDADSVEKAYIGETGYPRRRVGNTEHYLVGRNVNKNKCGVLIEDEDGTDLYGAAFSTWGSASIRILNDEDEIYAVASDPDPNHSYDNSWYIMDGNFKKICRTGDDMPGPTKAYCIDYKKFRVYAFSTDEPYNCQYFDKGGNSIDLVKYVGEHGAKITDGTYYDDYDKKFIRDIKQFGAGDEKKKKNVYLKRFGMYIVGKNGNMWIEDANGRDITDTINGSISVFHAGCKVFRIKYANGSTALLSSDGKKFAEGYKSVKTLDFGEFYVIAASKGAASPYDKDKNIYFTPDGERISIDEYLKNRDMEISGGCISNDTSDETDKRGRWDGWDGSMQGYEEKVYDREYIKEIDSYLVRGKAQFQHITWIENADGKDIYEFDGGDVTYIKKDGNVIFTESGSGYINKSVAALNESKGVWFYEFFGNESADIICARHRVFKSVNMYSSECTVELRNHGGGGSFLSGGKKYKYFHCLHFGDRFLITAAKEDISPYDTENTDYYIAVNGVSDMKKVDITEFLKENGLKLSDLTDTENDTREYIETTEQTTAQAIEAYRTNDFVPQYNKSSAAKYSVLMLCLLAFAAILKIFY